LKTEGDDSSNCKVNLEPDALIEVETALAENEEEEEFSRGGNAKCRLQILLEKDSPSRDEEDLLQHLTAY